MAPAAPATDDGATITAILTSLFAGTRLPDAEGTSARAAYQDALYGRAVLVDLRHRSVRRREGDVGGVEVVTLDGSHALSRLERLAADAPVVLVSSDGTHAARIASHLRSLGYDAVESISGGFAAWRAGGLPLRAPLAA